MFYEIGIGGYIHFGMKCPDVRVVSNKALKGADKRSSAVDFLTFLWYNE